jgi:hypothetical protein
LSGSPSWFSLPPLAGPRPMLVLLLIAAPTQC